MGSYSQIFIFNIVQFNYYPSHRNMSLFTLYIYKYIYISIYQRLLVSSRYNLTWSARDILLNGRVKEEIWK